MESSGTSQTGAMPEFNVRHAVSQLILSFFKGMTEEQWGLLKSCKPDDSTTTMMAELLLEIIAAMTKAFLIGLDTVNRQWMEDGAKIDLGDVISQGFAEALGVDDAVQCPSSKILTQLIAQDVSESVQSALSSPEGIIQRLTPPSRLNDMILHACKMCKVFIGKMKSVFSPRPRKQRTTSEESDTEPEPSDADDRFARACIHRIVAQMMNRFHRDSEVHSRESAKSLTKKINHLLKDNRDLLGLVDPHTDIPSDRVLEFTKLLSDLLYRHIVDGPEILPASIQEPVKHAGMLADLQRKVFGFLSLTRWWQIFKAGDLADKMRDVIQGTESQPLAIPAQPGPVCVMKSRDDSPRAARKEKNRICVETFLETLVMRIFKKAKVTWTISNVQDIIQRLLERTLAEVEGVDFECGPETFGDLEKTICRDLCKKWGNAAWLLVSLKSDKPALGDCIASSVKDHLMAPRRERSFMRRFFPSLLTAMTMGEGLVLFSSADSGNFV
ncbi:uncharacterized protein LOC119478162 [Sebastes umbrosus]|uniref:uncharacterized protein LOC119478162 n=1 Tax=Sebastes umbrosus TaxID=72105 RepID=UPI0018A0F6EC|nr:uncharacterized protein LOC119478162 [Sebastes umbrosus]